MAFRIYKPGQGYWTRLLTAIGVATIVLASVRFLWRELSSIASDDIRLYTQAGVCVGLILISGVVLWKVLNKSNAVDFMIATDAEMRKVNWPSRREIILSTVVVICGTFFLTLILWVINIVFGFLFIKINILESPA